MITAEQVGDRRSSIYNHLRMDMGSNFQPTGFAAVAGQQINVYVEAGGSINLPTMTFTQFEGSWSNWQSTIQLKEGKNVITVPSIPTDHNYTYTVTRGGPIYISNPYTADQQNGAPIVRIEGATEFPLMTKDIDPDDFKAELIAYNELLAKDRKQALYITDRKMINVVEIMSDHVILTGRATMANDIFIKGNTDPQDVINGYDEWMHKIFAFHGLDGSSEKHDPTLIRESIRLMQPYGIMYAAGDHTGIQYDQDADLMRDLGTSYAGWALNHEIGHRIDIHARELGEITNNMLSMHMSVIYNSLDNRIPFDNSIYKNVIKENQVQASQLDLATRLGAFWQIELAYPGYWTEVERLYRERKITASSQAGKEQKLIQISSEAVGKDLSSHFACHGYTISEETKQITSLYDEPKNIWYLNNTVINYKGNGFANTATVKVTTEKGEGKNTLTFSVDEAANADLLGYEIVRNGEVIAFTRAKPSNDDQVSTNLNLVIEAVKTALSDSNVKRSDIRAIVAGNPAVDNYAGIDAELYVKKLVEEQLATIPGTIEIVIHNSTDSTTVDEMIKRDLTITYQLAENEPTYIYKKGKTSIQKEA